MANTKNPNESGYNVPVTGESNPDIVTPPPPDPNEPVKGNNANVTARRGQHTRSFTRRLWDMLGANKEGWVIVTGKPKEVQELEDKQKQQPKK